MPNPSQIILLVEDGRHQQFILNYLRRAGLKMHAMRIRKAPSGAGSAEQWVREQFASEVKAYRGRQAETQLVVLMDSDTRTVGQRIRQLDEALHQRGAQPIDRHAEKIARLFPKRNIETWILCLNAVLVNEDTDYKRTRDHWTDLIRSAASVLYTWTRPNAAIPASCVESLRDGIAELRNLGL
jgi:hypothetical protein